MSKELAVTIFFFAISGTGNVALAIAWWRASRNVRRLERHADAPYLVDDRSLELERTVQSLAAQVEQLASGQEFLGRLIAERHDQARVVAAPPPKPITPH